MEPTRDVRMTRLFERHYAEVLAYCARRIGRSDADDAAAEVFATAWRRIDEVDWSTVKPWLYGISRHVVANRWRSFRRWTRLTRKVSGLARGRADSPESVIMQRDEDLQVRRALRRLSATDQEVLRLAAWEELTAGEIGQVMQISASAAEKTASEGLGPAGPDPRTPDQ